MPEQNNDNAQNDQIDVFERIRRIEELNRMIAHNLRGGISNIRMLTEMLTEKKTTKAQLRRDENTLTTSEGLKYICDSSSALLTTLSTFMEVSDIHLNDQLQYEDCNIQEIVRHVVSQLHGFARMRKAVIELTLSVPGILYPKVYMESIMYNLVSNAIKYARTDVPLHVQISTFKENGKTVMTVKDNGIGMDMKTSAKRIFKVHQTFHKGYDSKGIGLYITRMQIESMGGTISVTSEVMGGAEFKVTF